MHRLLFNIMIYEMREIAMFKTMKRFVIIMLTVVIQISGIIVDTTIKTCATPPVDEFISTLCETNILMNAYGKPCWPNDQHDIELDKVIKTLRANPEGIDTLIREIHTEVKKVLKSFYSFNPQKKKSIKDSVISFGLTYVNSNDVDDIFKEIMGGQVMAIDIRYEDIPLSYGAKIMTALIKKIIKPKEEKSKMHFMFQPEPERKEPDKKQVQLALYRAGMVALNLGIAPEETKEWFGEDLSAYMTLLGIRTISAIKAKSEFEAKSGLKTKDECRTEDEFKAPSVKKAIKSVDTE